MRSESEKGVLKLGVQKTPSKIFFIPKSSLWACELHKEKFQQQQQHLNALILREENFFATIKYVEREEKLVELFELYLRATHEKLWDIFLKKCSLISNIWKKFDCDKNFRYYCREFHALKPQNKFSCM